MLNLGHHHHHPPHPPLPTTFDLQHRMPVSPAQGFRANYQRNESCPSLERTHLIFSRTSLSRQEVKHDEKERRVQKEEQDGEKKGGATRVA